MKESPRCLYDSSFPEFLRVDENAILGLLCDHYHGDARTTTREAWKGEICGRQYCQAPDRGRLTAVLVKVR